MANRSTGRPVPDIRPSAARAASQPTGSGTWPAGAGSYDLFLGYFISVYPDNGVTMIRVATTAAAVGALRAA
jgi:hypothetical protein